VQRLATWGGSPGASQDLDPRDEVFVQDSHEPPRLLVAGAPLGSRGRKFCAHFVAKLNDLHFESRHALGQLLEELNPSFEHIHTFFERFLRRRCLPRFVTAEHRPLTA
jgi:hypothetical protein